MRLGVSGSYKPHSTESRKHKPLDNTVFQKPDNTLFINEQRVCAVRVHIFADSHARLCR